MPNWCSANIEVSGKPKDVLNFCKLFIFEESEEKNKPYFARSFIHTSWKDFTEEIKDGTDGSFNVEFAWSATSCLIDGYPQDSNRKCITLMDACKKHNVEVSIETEEQGMGFEELIVCNAKGVLITNECNDMPTYKCECGAEQGVPSSSLVGDVDCYECDEIGKGVIKWNN